MNQLEQALLEVSNLLDKNRVPYMVIGGTALILWGHSRSTLDLDITVWTGPGAEDSLVDLLGRNLVPRVGEAKAFVAQSRVLPTRTKGGVPVDIIFGLLPYEEEAIKRAVEKKVGSAQVRVASVEDLILHKVISPRPRDEEDVRFLITRHSGEINRERLGEAVRRVSEELSEPLILDRYKGGWLAR